MKTEPQTITITLPQKALEIRNRMLARQEIDQLQQKMRSELRGPFNDPSSLSPTDKEWNSQRRAEFLKEMAEVATNYGQISYLLGMAKFAEQSLLGQRESLDVAISHICQEIHSLEAAQAKSDAEPAKA